MPIAQADRIAFSLYEVTAPAKVKGLQMAQASLNSAAAKSQSLDTANSNLFAPVNTLINQYQAEFNNIDGNNRTTITEQNIVDSANKKLSNYFFPNNTSISVPSLSSLGNVWPYANPFGLSYGVGLDYTQGYPSTVTPNENAQIAAIQAIFTSLSANTDIQNTTGQIAQSNLSLPIITFTALQTLSTNLIAAVNSWKTALMAEATAIAAIVDSNTTNTANNTAAANNINNVILPAINTWLALPAFTPLSGTTTGSAFNATLPSTVLPHPQLYSANLSTFTAAVTARASFVATRTAQLNAVLGTVTQDLTNGNVLTSTGFYGQRYGYLALRLNALNGSLTLLAGQQMASNAQTSIISNTQTTASTYYSILPTSGFQSNANGTPFISLVDVSFLNVGDSVYVVADNQNEIPMAVKTIVGNAVTLNDAIPAKYTTSSNARLYKDLT